MHSGLIETSNPKFEQLLRDGINAVKSGQRRLAQSLLRQAILLDGTDARPYVWLSGTTGEPDEQRAYLERAVGIDPYNTAARRGLAALNGKLEKTAQPPVAAMMGLKSLQEVEETGARSFTCPECGGRISFSIQAGQLCCEYCAYVLEGDVDTGHNAALKAAHELCAGQAAEPSDHVLDFTLSTRLGRLWCDACQRIACEQCGAVALLPPGRISSQCPYCGSNRVAVTQESSEILTPQVIALLKVDKARAESCVRRWLARGLFTPDDLLAEIYHLQLRPAYYSCWAFDGTIEARWTCEVKAGHSRIFGWTPRSGTLTCFFDDVLVPGVQTLTMRELESIEPFNLKTVQEFKPEYLAGWPALIYDRSLADASLLAREKALKELRGEAAQRIEMGVEKRNLRLAGGNWSGMTYKHVLLPLWIGTYHYQGKELHLLVNGETGKVGGIRPRDPLKITLAFLVAGLAVALLLILLFWRLGWRG